MRMHIGMKIPQKKERKKKWSKKKEINKERYMCRFSAQISPPKARSMQLPGGAAPHYRLELLYFRQNENGEISFLFKYPLGGGGRGLRSLASHEGAVTYYSLPQVAHNTHGSKRDKVIHWLQALNPPEGKG